MEKDYKDRIKNLKMALLEFLGMNNRHYGDLTRIEQSVEDLAQALNTRLDQLLISFETGCGTDVPVDESPRNQLADRLMDTAVKLSKGGKVDQEMADDFGHVLEIFDLAADLKRQSETVKDSAETAAIKHKRDRS